MSRPLRIEFAGALYHVTARGDRQESIYEDDEDRRSFLGILGTVVEDFNWMCHAYCLMGNHYHLLVETPEGNLAKGMRQLNGLYTQWSNRRHRRVGHLFQGRYKAILVDKDSYLLELCRYVVLNPVRARMVKSPRQWPWSSHRAMLGVEGGPKWLLVEALLAQFARGLASARERYERFVAQGMQATAPWDEVRGQIYLGDDRFVDRMQRKLGQQADDINIPKAQRRGPAPALAQIERAHKSRNGQFWRRMIRGVTAMGRLANISGFTSRPWGVSCEPAGKSESRRARNGVTDATMLDLTPFSFLPFSFNICAGGGRSES